MIEMFKQKVISKNNIKRISMIFLIIRTPSYQAMANLFPHPVIMEINIIINNARKEKRRGGAIASKNVPGYREIQLFRRLLNGKVEFIIIMWIDPYNAVRQFSGTGVQERWSNFFA